MELESPESKNAHLIILLCIFFALLVITDWHKLGEIDLTIDWLYDMGWDNIELENMRVAAAPFGGPIAMVRDSRKMVMLTGGSAQPILRIFTSSGIETARFVLTGSKMVGMGWSDELILHIVDSSGYVSCYDVHGEQLPTEFSMGQACEQEGLVDCRVYGTGIVALTNFNHLWSITDLHDPRPQKMSDLDTEEVPRAIEVLHKRVHGIEVILAVDTNVILADMQQAVEFNLTFGTIKMLALSPNNEIVSIYTQDNLLVVLSSDFAQNYLTFTPPIDTPPLQISWCGNDVVGMSYPDVSMLVGSTGDWVSFSTKEGPHLVTEMDGLRLITSSKHFLIRRVTDAMFNVYSEESDHHGRTLYLARKAFDEQNARADKIIREIKNYLNEAIDTIIEVAESEIELNRQRTLLKAACYGIAFCKQYPNQRLFETCQQLRVLNAVRDASVGMPLTFVQMCHLTIPVVVARLVNSYHHLLALRICKALGMTESSVLRHWACARISVDNSTTPDSELKDILVEKLSKCTGIKYATIAEHAQAQGRKELAALLLDYEFRAAEQVPLLLRLGEDDRALDRAVESGDTDLVYLTLFHMYKRSMNTGMFGNDFIESLRNNKRAFDLFVKYCKSQEPEIAEQVYISTSQSDGLAQMRFEEALSKMLTKHEELGSSSSDTLVEATHHDHIVNLLREAADFYIKYKKGEFNAKCSEEYAQLRKVQENLQKTTGRNVFLGLSVTNTIRQCIRLNHSKSALEIKRQFQISDKHYYWIKIKTLALMADWDALESFANEKRPPIGWETFVNITIKHNAPTDKIAIFIEKMPDSELKADLYSSIGLTLQASRVGENLKNSDYLSKIQGIVGSSGSLSLKSASNVFDRLRKFD